jgi:hypothetical protein
MELIFCLCRGLETIYGGFLKQKGRPFLVAFVIRHRWNRHLVGVAIFLVNIALKTGRVSPPSAEESGWIASRARAFLLETIELTGGGHKKQGLTGRKGNEPN